MKCVFKGAFTLIELMIVITVLAILGTGSFFLFWEYINNATYSNENTVFNQSSQQIDRKFIKSFGIDGLTNTDHMLRYDLNQGVFDVGTIDNSDTSALTYSEAGQVFIDDFWKSFWLNSQEFNVQVCDRDVTNANLDIVLNNKTTNRFYELIVFTDEVASGTDCNGIITAWTTQIAWYTFRYKNEKLNGKSSDYDSDKKLDRWTRTSATAINSVWENVKWVFKGINSTLTVSNKWF